MGDSMKVILKEVITSSTTFTVALHNDFCIDSDVVEVEGRKECKRCQNERTGQGYICSEEEIIPNIKEIK